MRNSNSNMTTSLSRVKDELRSRGIMITHVARATGINYSTLMSWLNGRSQPFCVGEAIRLAEYLNSINIECELKDVCSR